MQNTDSIESWFPGFLLEGKRQKQDEIQRHSGKKEPEGLQPGIIIFGDKIETRGIIHKRWLLKF